MLVRQTNPQEGQRKEDRVTSVQGPSEWGGDRGGHEGKDLFSIIMKNIFNNQLSKLGDNVCLAVKRNFIWMAKEVQSLLKLACFVLL